MTSKSHFGPYQAITQNGRRILQYAGNKVYPKHPDVSSLDFAECNTHERFLDTITNPRFAALHEIDHLIFDSVTKFFRERGTQWVNLPLTTLMISSPGEVYAGKTLDYTTDTLPVTLNWFDSKRSIFLAESSQFYLELRLANCAAREVFSIYNSFRKEKADFSHLSEFQHIEYEGKISLPDLTLLIKELLCNTLQNLLSKGHSSLAVYLDKNDIKSLEAFTNINCYEEMCFKDALDLLREETGDERYREFSLKNFGSWEEVMLTQLIGKPLILKEFPLMQIPFYHNELKSVSGCPVAENADFILPGARETVGAGSRISSLDALKEKARVFNLPPEDYDPYLEIRKLPSYEKTSGFGLGWQRYVHWLLKLPAIWEASHFPRGHTLPKP